VSLVDLVKLMIEIAGRGSYRLVPFPPERKRIDIGDFYSDSGKLRRTLGWKPSVSLRDGLARTIEYYSRHKDQYL
jgi:UDP-glucose 4-epimerase